MPDRFKARSWGKACKKDRKGVGNGPSLLRPPASQQPCSATASIRGSMPLHEPKHAGGQETPEVGAGGREPAREAAVQTAEEKIWPGGPQPIHAPDPTTWRSGAPSLAAERKPTAAPGLAQAQVAAAPRQPTKPGALRLPCGSASSVSSSAPAARFRAGWPRRSGCPRTPARPSAQEETRLFEWPPSTAAGCPR